MHYQLHAHCRLVQGAARSAIYDLQTGKVYSINQSAVRLLSRAQGADSEKAALESDAGFFDRLTQKGLGGFYFSASPQPDAPREEAAPALEFAWLELTARCNCRCLHCYADAAPSDTPGALSLERRLALLDELREANCSAVQLIGGEPLLYPHWRALVEGIAARGFEFCELFTNATLVDDEILDFLDAHRVQIATTLYAADAPLHDAVTQTPGSFAKTMRAIRKILARRIPLRIASIIMKTNEQAVGELQKLCASLGVEDAPPDTVRPTGRGADEALRPETYRRPPIRPPFFTSDAEFQLAHSYHACLAGKIAVTEAGEVLPCVFARNLPCGNLHSQSLADILRGEPLQSVWRTTKDAVTKCKDCEYRYACPDCRPLAQSLSPSGAWNAAPADCAYDPYTGVWKA